MRVQGKAQTRGQWLGHGKRLQRRPVLSGKEHVLHAHTTHAAHATHIRHAAASFVFWRF